MRESEAAAFLGVSVRSMHRYRKAGKLSCRRVRGDRPGRPVLDYDEQDLVRLKAELRPPTACPEPNGPPANAGAARTPRVSFGLPQGEHAEFREEAARYGMSPGEYARHLVREGLESRLRSEAQALSGEIQGVRSEVRALRAEVASAFEVLLEYVGLPPQEARQWVTHNLR